jgi:hypothetical protein
MAQPNEQAFDLETHLLLNQLNAEDEAVTRGEELPLPEIACISLGERCSAALAFRRRAISTAYYPFDFIATPLKGLHLLLKTTFRNFLNKKLLTVTKSNGAWLDETNRTIKAFGSVEKMVVVKNKRTGCDFVHDFKDEKLENYQTVFEKYQRRIDRFYRTITQAKHVYFFRTHMTKKEATELLATLKKAFPKKSFTLVAPTDPEHMQKPWHLAGVKEFLMYDNTSRSQKRHGSVAAWDNIFKTLGLL